MNTASIGYYNSSGIAWSPGYLFTSPPSSIHLSSSPLLLSPYPSPSSSPLSSSRSLIPSSEVKVKSSNSSLVLPSTESTSTPSSSPSPSTSPSSSASFHSSHAHHLLHHPTTTTTLLLLPLSSSSSFSSSLSLPSTESLSSDQSTLSPLTGHLPVTFTSTYFPTSNNTLETMSTSYSSGSTLSPGEMGEVFITWQEVTILLLKIIGCGCIILMAIFGNLLIIISVYRHQRLRITTNYFVVSLACADILVALFAMTFKASVAITGKWFLGKLVCDFWNSCDVLFSTASIMHLCCISVDRYYAIIKPLDYPMKITNRAVAIMLAVVWVSSTLISFVPIFTGLYTTSEHINYQKTHPDECSFKVNLPYSLISSSVSFWIPCTVMCVTYWRIYVEATKQEKMLYKHTQMIPKVQKSHHHHHHQHHHHHHQQQQQQQQHTQNTTAASTGSASGPGNNSNNINNNNNSSNSNNNNVTCESSSIPLETGNGSSSSGSHITVHAPPHRNSHGDDTESGQSTPTKRCINKMKREHKAAKTLGIIMGAFIACWLPFFVTYVTTSVCGDSCVDFPDIVVDTLFWVGYFNSAINPVIYAYFNREFREAFKETIQNVFCCCLQVECLQGPRNNSAIHFNCTYRSTQDIGLVENKYVKD